MKGQEMGMTFEGYRTGPVPSQGAFPYMLHFVAIFRAFPLYYVT